MPLSAIELRLRLVIRLGAFLAGLSICVASAGAQGPWVVTNLPSLGNSPPSAQPAAINDQGVVVGSSTTASLETHAFVWTPGAGMTDLGTLPGHHASEAKDVNNVGQIVGVSWWTSGPASLLRAFMWTAAGGMTDIGAGDQSRANGINDAGQIVGQKSFPGGLYHAFMRPSDGTFVDLGIHGGDFVTSTATAINDGGQVVGYSSKSGGSESRAFLWTAAGGMMDLGTPFGEGLVYVPTGINNAGQVVGNVSVSGSGQVTPWLWTAAGGMVALPGAGWAYGINDQGRVAAGLSIPGYLAATWSATEGWIAVTSEAPSLASAINNAGQVVGRTNLTGRVWSAPWLDLALDFGAAQGLWALKNLYVWQPVHALSPETAAATDPPAELTGKSAMVTGDLDGNGLDDLVVDFGAPYGVWVWMNHGTWVPLHGLSPTRMVTGNLDNDVNSRDELIVDFPGFGLWQWTNNTSWAPLHGLSSTHLATATLDGGGEELLVNFPGAGLWVYRAASGWSLLHGFDITQIASADLDGTGQDEVVVSFPGAGVWVYRNNATWAPLHSFGAIQLGSGDLDANGKDELIVNFGGTYGLWAYRNDTSWTLLNGFSPDEFVAGDLDGGGKADLAVDFGPHGVWIYQNDTTWRLLHPMDPEAMTLGRLH